MLQDFPLAKHKTDARTRGLIAALELSETTRKLIFASLLLHDLPSSDNAHATTIAPELPDSYDPL